MPVRDLFKIKLCIAAALGKVSNDFDDGDYENHVDQLNSLAKEVVSIDDLQRINKIIEEGKDLVNQLKD